MTDWHYSTTNISSRWLLSSPTWSSSSSSSEQWRSVVWRTGLPISSLPRLVRTTDESLCCTNSLFLLSSLSCWTPQSGWRPELRFSSPSGYLLAVWLPTAPTILSTTTVSGERLRCWWEDDGCLLFIIQSFAIMCWVHCIYNFPTQD